MGTGADSSTYRELVGWLDADEPAHRGALWGLAITGLAAATVAVAGTVRGGPPAAAAVLPWAWATVGWQTGRLAAADRRRFVGLLFGVAAAALLAATAYRLARSLPTTALFEEFWFTLFAAVAGAFLAATCCGLAARAVLAVVDYRRGPGDPEEVVDRVLEGDADR